MNPRDLPWLSATVLVTAALVICAALTLALHKIEQVSSRSLSHHYGWRSVLLTAWLGSAVHEGSHLLLCKLLRLRVVAFQLYEPDPRSGTLGYVHHAVREGRSPWAAASRFSVAISPLLAGVGLLVAAFAILLPDVFSLAVSRPGSAEAFSGEISSMGTMGTLGHRLIAALSALATPTRLKSGYFWLFVYLCLSVGLHMTPSRADMQRAWTGLGLVAALCLVGGSLLAARVGVGSSLPIIASLLAPVGFVMSAAAVLGMVYLCMVKAVTLIFP